MKRNQILSFIIISIMCLMLPCKALAFEPAFRVRYDATSSSFVLEGEAKAGSRVLLIVYSPLYENSSFSRL